MAAIDCAPMQPTSSRGVGRVPRNLVSTLSIALVEDPCAEQEIEHWDRFRRAAPTVASWVTISS
jgi:hypothetical protein